MITVKDYMECVDYRITEASEWLWNCFGPNAFTFDCWNGDHNGFNVGIVFDTKTTTVYKFEVHDYKKQNSYRWVHPEYNAAYIDEAKARNINNAQAYDDINFIDIELSDDIIEKATCIVMGIDYDERVQISLDLPENLQLQLFTLAHQQDITLNQLVENILKLEIEKRQNAA